MNICQQLHKDTLIFLTHAAFMLRHSNSPSKASTYLPSQTSRLFNGRGGRQNRTTVHSSSRHCCATRVSYSNYLFSPSIIADLDVDEQRHRETLAA